jgi:hypothetical protein
MRSFKKVVRGFSEKKMSKLPSPFTCSNFCSMFSYDNISKWPILVVNVLISILHLPSPLGVLPSPARKNTFTTSGEGW